MNILYVANLIPYPLDSGGKIFTFSTIQALSKDNEIDLICFYEHEDINAGTEKLREVLLLSGCTTHQGYNQREYAANDGKSGEELVL